MVRCAMAFGMVVGSIPTRSLRLSSLVLVSTPSGFELPADSKGAARGTRSIIL